MHRQISVRRWKCECDHCHHKWTSASEKLPPMCPKCGRVLVNTRVPDGYNKVRIGDWSCPGCGREYTKKDIEEWGVVCPLHRLCICSLSFSVLTPFPPQQPFLELLV